MTSTRPNIILINCDDLGYGDLGCYGSEVNKTPALDRMADEGMRFTDFYQASAVCSPSRGAMLTGCYPRRIGFGSFEGRWVLFPGQAVGLNQEEKTVASLLKEQGYATMLVGKWHCGDQPEFLPTRHGFDHYYGIPYSNDMGRQAGREHYPPLPLMDDEAVIQEQPDQTSITERYVERSVRFIRENKDQPFFLYFAHMYVHLPLYAPQRFLRQSENGSYGAAVECIDWAASVLFDEIKELGLDENTLIVFTSDNGSRGRDEGGSNAPLRGGKGSTWEGGQRLPCIMRWPDKIPARTECNEMTLSMDFLPTFAELAGSDVPDDRIIDGKSILPLMSGEEGAATQHDSFFYYFKDDIQAVRSGNWKLHIRRRDDEVAELYDLASDIGETENVHDQHPDVVENLLSKIQSCREDIGDGAADMEGANCRPVGLVENADTLTHYDPDHPYIVAMYDIEDSG
ncbi:MAG: sulfatase [Planctomycetota bacterium]|jgi:arylsulfatase A-like enzyme|nr:sulfatase [Planctomycetota bacterium]